MTSQLNEDLNERLTVALVPCHNAEPHVIQCLESCLQEFNRVIICFDGCTDNSFEEVLDWKERLGKDDRWRLRMLENSSRFGVQRTRNILYSFLRQEYGIDNVWVCYQDADDYRKVGTLQEVFIQYDHTLNTRNYLGIITPHSTLIRDILYREEIYQETLPSWGSTPEEFKSDAIPPILPVNPSIWELLIYRKVQTGGILWKASALEKILQKFDRVWDESLKGMQDNSLLLDALSLETPYFLISPIQTHYYRWGWSDEQISIRDQKTYMGEITKFFNRLKTECPGRYEDLCHEEWNRTITHLERLQQDYKLHSIPKITPSFL